MTIKDAMMLHATDLDAAYRGRRRRLHSAWYTPYLFLLPFFGLFIPFGIGALALGVGISFTDWPVGHAPYINGVENYQAVIDDPLAATSLWNTVKMLVVFLAILIPVCLLIAVCFSALRSWRRRAAMVVLYLPIAMSLVAVALIFDLLYDPQIGLINSIAKTFGSPGIPLLTDPAFAPWAIVVLRLWRVIGYYAIILFAGLQSVPHDVYDAAAIDGAGPFRTFWSVTLPLLKPVTVFVLVASSIAAWELFAEPSILTQGGPVHSTYTAVMYIYQATFQDFDLGRGAAAGVLLAICIVIVTLIINRAFKERTNAE
jgi:ABC-type sugar transport system permease subunit